MGVRILGLPVRTARIGLISLIVVDVLALAAFSVHVSEVTTSTRTPPESATIAQAAPAPAPSDAPLPTAATLSADAQAIAAGTLLGQSGSGVTLAVPVAAAGPRPSHAVVASPHPSASPSGDARPATDGKTIAPCPVDLTDSDASGGLQSLVPFAPAFGPFAGEAFAAAAAYQPALELVGPLLAQYPQLEPVIGPYVTQFLGIAAQGTNALGALINPIYGPYKTQFIAAEAQLASAIAPYSEDLAYSPLGGCVTELENALIAQGSKLPKP